MKSSDCRQGLGALLSIMLLSASPVLAADKPVPLVPKEASVAADTVAAWLQKLEGQTADKIRKDLGTPTKELEWKVKDKRHPKLEYRLSDRTKMHVMFLGGKAFRAYAFTNTTPDPTEKTSTGVPPDIQQATQALSKWASSFDGYTPARAAEKLGPPTKTGDWEFMDGRHPQHDFQLTPQSRLELYFLKDRAIKAMAIVRSSN